MVNFSSPTSELISDPNMTLILVVLFFVVFCITLFVVYLFGGNNSSNFEDDDSDEEDEIEEEEDLTRCNNCRKQFPNDDTYNCEECGEYVCEECIIEFDEVDNICKKCIDKFYPRSSRIEYKTRVEYKTKTIKEPQEEDSVL